MICVICDKSTVYQIEQALSGLSAEYLTSESDQKARLQDKSFHPSAFLIVVSPVWPGLFEQHQDFGGVKIAASLRRDYQIKTPIIFLSVTGKEYLLRRAVDERLLLLIDAKGTGFLPLPWLRESIEKATEQVLPLSDSELTDIITTRCDTWGAWARTFHVLERLVREKCTDQVSSELLPWPGVIARARPELATSFEALRHTLELEDSNTSTQTKLKMLEEFDSRFVESGIPEADVQTRRFGKSLPKCPPKGFSRLLIADDVPQDYLASSLRSEFRFEVIKPQATKLSQAKHLLDVNNPAVVLADLFFRKSDRLTEVPRRVLGEEFIKYATKDQKRLVLVTSKASIRSEDLPAGAINCSGRRATNAAAVHEAVWSAALARGVTEPERIDGQDWGPEVICRQRLEPYDSILPKIIVQWSYLPSLLTETLNLTKLLNESATDSDRVLTEQLQSILESLDGKQDLSLREIRDLFRRTADVHELAKLEPQTPVSRGIRNILHGKIEQFSSVTNAIDQMRTVFKEVGEDLTSIPGRRDLGESLVAVLDHAETQELLPLLYSSNTILSEILSALPPLPGIRDAGHIPTDANRKFRIVIVEDSSYWRGEILEVCEELAKIYSGRHEIAIESFDNAADALAAIAPRSKTHALKDDGTDVATLAILDICIPMDLNHAQNIRRAGSGEANVFDSPQSTHGLELIRKLSEFGYNVPIIVFSKIDSVSDRKKVCGWGVPEANFISKGPDAQEHLKLAISRFAEKSNKYVISRHTSETRNGWDDENSETIFRINGIKVDLPPAIFDTFTSLYDLRQRTERRAFTFAEIIENQGKQTTPESLRILQDHINRIREKIFETAHRNRIYVDVHEIIRTQSDLEENIFTYELNAEIPTIWEEDRDPREDDIDALALRNKVLLIGGDVELFSSLGDVLQNRLYEVKELFHSQDVLKHIDEFEPDMVILSADTIDDPINKWKSVQEASLYRDIGVLFVSTSLVSPWLANELVQNGALLDNVISNSVPNWLGDFLQAFENERRRVFVGDAAEISSDLSFPIVEILENTNLQAGVLDLLVDEKPFQMKPRGNSFHAQIFGRLLASPAETIPWQDLQQCIGLPTLPSNDDRKNWTKRLREKIAGSWLSATDEEELHKQAKLVLESSSDGLKLNVRTIDHRVEP